jgi:HD-like signal output (HDOD) protein
MDHIQEFCREKGLPSSTMEDLSAGMNHADIGALIAEKWNFPEALVSVVRYHHNPSAAPEKYRTMVETVYLANIFCDYEIGNITFEQIDPEVLESFGISTKNQVDKLLERFTAGFTKETL